MTEQESHEQLDECEVCHQPTDIQAIIPRERAGRSWDTLACIPCAKELGLFCTEHDREHTGFGDGTSACIKCINTEVDRRGDEITTSFLEIIEKSPKKTEILKEIDEWLKEVSIITGETDERCIARAIITAAQRFNRPVDEMIAETAELGPKVLLPWLE